jgi:hypothetical protein
MTEAELITRTAAAIKRENDARQAYEKARIEAGEARQELSEAWTALREYQDNQVKSALRLVA